MTQVMDTAVILAAGLGSRLGDLKKDRPKAFLKVGEETLIERSIRLLKQNGITRIILGTGFGSIHFERLSEQHPEISTARNPIFANSGSMYTLYLLRELVNGPILLLEGDLLYEQAALEELQSDPRQDIILASGQTDSGDEVYLQGSRSGLLENMSKDQSELTHISGELVGISKLSTEALEAMNRFAEKSYSHEDFQPHYEDALTSISRERELSLKVVEHLLWCEIDDASHLRRAETLILPRIYQKENRN